MFRDLQHAGVSLRCGEQDLEMVLQMHGAMEDNEGYCLDEIEELDVLSAVK